METLKDNSYGAIPIFKENGQYLILLVKHKAGHWAFPKGHPKVGESQLDTAKREFREETGLKGFDVDEKASFVEHYAFEYENKLYDKKVVYYPIFARDKTVNIPEEFKDEILECRWLTFDEALKLVQFPSTKQIIQRAKKYSEQSV